MRKRCVEEHFIDCALILESGKSTGVLERSWKTVAEKEYESPFVIHHVVNKDPILFYVL